MKSLRHMGAGAASSSGLSTDAGRAIWSNRIALGAQLPVPGSVLGSYPVREPPPLPSRRSSIHFSTRMFSP